jgi:hypothetical protein
MIEEQSVECQLKEETEVLGENLPQFHFVHTLHLLYCYPYSFYATGGQEVPGGRLRYYSRTGSPLLATLIPTARENSLSGWTLVNMPLLIRNPMFHHRDYRNRILGPSLSHLNREQYYRLGYATCSPVEFYRLFSGRYCLHLQGLEIGVVSNQQYAGSRKSCITSQKVLFIVTA